MKKLLILLITFTFATELEVDGDLKVTGNIQNDSLIVVIANLQAQISELQIQVAQLVSEGVYVRNANTITNSNDNDAEYIFDSISLQANKPVKIYMRYDVNSFDNNIDRVVINLSHPIYSLKGYSDNFNIQVNTYGGNGDGWDIGGFTPLEDIDFNVTLICDNVYDNWTNSEGATCSAQVLIIQ